MTTLVETNIRPKEVIKTKLTTITRSTIYNYLYFRLILYRDFP